MKKITNDKHTKKLKLNPQTIAVLSTTELGVIAGGGGSRNNSHLASCYCI